MKIIILILCLPSIVFAGARPVELGCRQEDCDREISSARVICTGSADSAKGRSQPHNHAVDTAKEFRATLDEGNARLNAAQSIASVADRSQAAGLAAAELAIAQETNANKCRNARERAKNECKSPCKYQDPRLDSVEARWRQQAEQMKAFASENMRVSAQTALDSINAQRAPAAADLSAGQPQRGVDCSSYEDCMIRFSRPSENVQDLRGR